MVVSGLDLVFGYRFVSCSVFRPPPVVMEGTPRKPVQGKTMGGNEVSLQRSDGTVFRCRAILHLAGSRLVGRPRDVHMDLGNSGESDGADDGRCCVLSGDGPGPGTACTPQEEGNCEKDRN